MISNRKYAFIVLLHRFVCKHGVAPRKIAVKCNSHHRQWISLSSRLKTRIDFEKLGIGIEIDRYCQNKKVADWRPFCFGRGRRGEQARARRSRAVATFAVSLAKRWGTPPSKLAPRKLHATCEAWFRVLLQVFFFPLAFPAILWYNETKKGVIASINTAKGKSTNLIKGNML